MGPFKALHGCSLEQWGGGAAATRFGPGSGRVKPLDAGLERHRLPIQGLLWVE